MAKSNKNLSSLVSELTKGHPRLGSGSINGLTEHSTNSESLSIAMSAGRDTEVRSQGLNTLTQARAIAFGRASSNPSSETVSESKELMNLLTRAASGGLASALGIGSIGGIGSLISGIASFFGGGKSTSPPLVAFQLPVSQNKSLNVGNKIVLAGQPNVVDQKTTSGQLPGIYGSSNDANQVTSGQWIQDNNAHIAQAVKTALLHSSSLADVICEV